MTPLLIGQMIDDLNQFASFGKHARAQRQSGTHKLMKWLFLLLVTGLIIAALAFAVAAQPSLSPM